MIIINIDIQKFHRMNLNHPIQGKIPILRLRYSSKTNNVTNKEII